MAENIIMIAGLVLSAALLYYAIGRLFDTIDPPRPAETTEEKYRIALEDLVFARELSRFLKPDECRYLTGTVREIAAEMETGRVDLAVLNSESGECGRKMNHIRVQYYASVLALQENGIDIQLLKHQARTIEVYYKDRFAPVITQMMDKGVIVRA